MDLGAPASYLTLSKGVPVYAAGGEEVGEVAEVIAAVEQDIFDGVVVSSGHLSSRRRFVEAARVEQIGERGLALSIDEATFEGLPERGS